MYKIAILGCENTHANSFLRQIYQKGRHTDIEVIGIYSDEGEPCRKLHETFGVPVMERYDELVGKVDGIMVTARHGDKHYKYAKPYLASGIPMFIDKPVTVSGEEAVALLRFPKRSKAARSAPFTAATFVHLLKLTAPTAVSISTLRTLCK